MNHSRWMGRFATKAATSKRIAVPTKTRAVMFLPELMTLSVIVCGSRRQKKRWKQIETSDDGAYGERLVLGPSESVEPLSGSQVKVRVADLLP